jgi:hypothetical protein
MLGDLIAAAHLTTLELDYHDGHLVDDATVLLLEWHGPAPYRPADVETLAGLPPDSVPAEVLSPAWGTPPSRDEA